MNFCTLIASGFGTGYAPKAPGTFGSLLGLALGAALLTLGHLALFLGIIAAAALGTYAIARLPAAAAQDPGWIVIDEVAGQMLPLLALAHLTLWGALLSFVLFRLFDIWKPGPVAWADKRHDAYGVMGDDLIAGALAAYLVMLVRLVSPL